jgi:tetratricopeptide (TPR) repeat protein
LGLREKFSRLAEELLIEGQKDKAIKVLDKITNLLPHERFTYNYDVFTIANTYFVAGQKEKGEKVLKKMQQVTIENLDYFNSLSKTQLDAIEFDVRLNLYLLHEIIEIAERNHLEDISKGANEYWKGLDNKVLIYMQKG